LCCLCVCVSVCVSYPNFFIFCALRVVSREGKWLVLPRTSCYVLGLLLGLTEGRCAVLVGIVEGQGADLKSHYPCSFFQWLEYSANVKNMWSHTFTVPYLFSPRCSSLHSA
jgi:hypothetical protein